ncbi:MAG: hypothetical protein PHF57_10450 [Methanoregula sp.]|nr:hypothetical protein [Methanoregula sp.]
MRDIDLIRSLKIGVDLPLKRQRVLTSNLDTTPPDNADYSPDSYQMTHPLSAQELFQEEARWNGVFTKIAFLKIAEREVLFLRSAERRFLAGIAEADGR